jgi:hypothetical protein
VNRFTLRTPSPSMAVALTALFMSLGGTGYAATQLGNSPAAAVAKKAKKKKAAPNDKVADKKLFTSLFASMIPSAHVAFAATADNASTATNATNATNATHAMSADSATNAGHASNSDQLGGVGASHYVTPGSTLSSGDTETGSFGVGAGENQVGVAPISFIPKLAAAPSNSEYVPSGTTTHCPGPGQATAGYLCVYGGWNYNMTFDCVGGITTACASTPTVDGAMVYFTSKAVEGNTAGTWAYKAS